MTSRTVIGIISSCALCKLPLNCAVKVQLFLLYYNSIVKLYLKLQTKLTSTLLLQGTILSSQTYERRISNISYGISHFGISIMYRNVKILPAKHWVGTERIR